MVRLFLLKNEITIKFTWKLNVKSHKIYSCSVFLPKATNLDFQCFFFFLHDSRCFTWYTMEDTIFLGLFSTNNKNFRNRKTKRKRQISKHDTIDPKQRTKTKQQTLFCRLFYNQKKKLSDKNHLSLVGSDKEMNPGFFFLILIVGSDKEMNPGFFFFCVFILCWAFTDFRILKYIKNIKILTL